ncbi:hypothetical protein F4679DRAFT_593040 [Xylaria curta]|nr:hypothetical protein F4679DRAFT_593040 [Xylaria curta]
MLSSSVIQVWVDEVAWEANVAGYTRADAIPCFSTVDSRENVSHLDQSSPLPPTKGRCFSSYTPKKRGRKKHQKPLAPAVANGPVLNNMAPNSEPRRSPRINATSNNESQPSLSANHGGGAAEETTGEDQNATTDDTPQLNIPLRPAEEPAPKRGRGRPPKQTEAPVAGQLHDTADQRSLPQQDAPSGQTGKWSRGAINNKHDLSVAGFKPALLHENLADLPAKTQTLVRNFQDVVDFNTGFIPDVIRQDVEVAIGRKVLDQAQQQYCLPKKEALYELRTLQTILSKSRNCKRKTKQEGVWNFKVYYPILELAFERDPVANMEVEPVTTATMIPDATDTAFKKVDFCITIDPGSPEQVKEIIRRQGPKLQTFNQTNAVRYEVIAISIETKIETASTTGEAQLAVWTKGWLNRMCLLLKKPKGTSAAPPLPMLRIRNEDWYMLLTYYDNAGELVILAEQQIGSTRDLWNMYKLLRCLRLLADWVDDEFRKYIDAVVVPDALELWVES